MCRPSDLDKVEIHEGEHLNRARAKHLAITVLHDNRIIGIDANRYLVERLGTTVVLKSKEGLSDGWPALAHPAHTEDQRILVCGGAVAQVR
jgi:hypothetical protein